MSKKDFIRLADYLRHVHLSEEALKAICDFCKASNPRFMENRFRDYLAGLCGPNGGTIKN
jgi:hypothetical protein